MSYILDALKKSDRERKRGDVPNLQTVHIPITLETQKPVLLYGVVFVLLLVLAVMIGMMISSEKETVYVVEQKDVDLQAVQVKKIEKNLAPAVSQQVVVQQKKSAVDNSKQIERVIDNKPVSKKAIEPLVVEKIKKPETKFEKRTTPLDLSVIPFLHEMPDYAQQSIPQMNFAGHVYSSNPESRSVIINGYAMSEGDVLIEGINIVEITTSGVVFSAQGELFRVDILQDWSFE